ncbi:MAG TPA: pyridoxine 5'-phosphate synthase [Polyangiaceae bacterium]|jgi:pyridoxine 5-phosphate synthase|nr:MAG: Pyridoxine 5'-phosphate synthase [Deltaproteobacteria bacterium ADurb.Bin207]HNS96479.1 pyridoxine 5'-phosphate synthase [Polyangiaceae bacterium]HNZ21395.1 pyridoxine 5'-phosphate synthase [Polyangiaceae bacterium]HOD23284.1 pyridoxine 5'-phosphate synthase [Polyangiaceae bacterium]HOE47428.1 pyridoxine 5'-phosphate synthase [Polyangiaceae bacterium]
MTIRLHVNIDHIATVRNARGTRYPDPIHAAYVCEDAGADGITAHLREDRRHMVDRDIERLRESITTLLNLEMAGTDEMIGIAERIRPDCITLVPERREERTTEGGLDVVGQRKQMEKVAERARKAGIRVSFFIAPEEAQLVACRDLGAEQVELHTGEYCNLSGNGQLEELERLRHAARVGHELGLSIAAGHGLTRFNLPAIAAIAEIEEVNIGHAIIADSLFMGLGSAVRAMREALNRGLALREK